MAAVEVKTPATAVDALFLDARHASALESGEACMTIDRSGIITVAPSPEKTHMDGDAKTGALFLDRLVNSNQPRGTYSRVKTYLVAGDGKWVAVDGRAVRMTQDMWITSLLELELMDVTMATRTPAVVATAAVLSEAEGQKAIDAIRKDISRLDVLWIRDAWTPVFLDKKRNEEVQWRMDQAGQAIAFNSTGGLVVNTDTRTFIGLLLGPVIFTKHWLTKMGIPTTEDTEEEATRLMFVVVPPNKLRSRAWPPELGNRAIARKYMECEQGLPIIDGMCPPWQSDEERKRIIRDTK